MPVSDAGYDDEDDDSRDRNQDMIDWLADKDPDIWFAVSKDLNWDSAMGVLDWIVAQPGCDRANAASIFWNCDPLYYMRNPQPGGVNADGLALMTKILRRWKSGFYGRAELAWRPEWDVRGRYDEVRNQLPGRIDPFDIPDDLLGPFDGRPPRVPRNLSAYHNPELRKLFWHLGTDIGHAPDSPEARRIERRLQRAAILSFYRDIFGFWGRAAAWMLPLGAVVIAGAFLLRWWNKGVLF